MFDLPRTFVTSILVSLLVGMGTVAPGARTQAAQEFRLQQWDDPAAPFVPARPRTAAEQDRLDALSWYMTGRLLESRNDVSAALGAYRKAVELDPEAIEIYRRLVPLAFQLDKTDDAVKYALKAVQIDPDDYELLHQLGVHMVSERRLTEAIRLLERAVDSSELDKQSANYVMLMRDLGILYSAIGQTKQAADSYEIVFDALLEPAKYHLDFRTRAALLSDPRTSFEQIGQILLDGKRPRLALKAFERAAETGRSAAGNLSYNLARVYLQIGKKRQALDELQKYLDAQRQAKGRAAYELLAEILIAMDKSSELLPRIESLAEQDRHNVVLQYFYAEQLVAAGQLERARAVYERMVKESGDTAGFLGLAGVYRRLAQPGDLLDVLSRALAKAGAENIDQFGPELEAIAAEEPLVDGLVAVGRDGLAATPVQLEFEQAYLLGRIAAAAGRTDDAVDFLQHGLQQGRGGRKLLFDELGDALKDARRFGEAANVYEQAVADPALQQERPNFLFQLSRARELNGQTEAALAAVAEASKLFPNHPLLEYQVGWIHYHSRNWDAAIQQFEKVIEKFARAPDIVRQAQFSLSNVYVQRGELSKGEEVLEAVLAEDPTDPAVNNDLGYLYADQGKHLEKAEKMIRLAVEAEPENPAYLDSLGWVLFKLGRFDEALPPLEKAVTIPSGGDVTIWDHLGDCYHRLGKLERAVGSWQKALDAAGESSFVDEKLLGRIKQKLQNHKPGSGVKPEQPSDP